MKLNLFQKIIQKNEKYLFFFRTHLHFYEPLFSKLDSLNHIMKTRLRGFRNNRQGQNSYKEY